MCSLDWGWELMEVEWPVAGVGTAQGLAGRCVVSVYNIRAMMLPTKANGGGRM